MNAAMALAEGTYLSMYELAVWLLPVKSISFVKASGCPSRLSIGFVPPSSADANPNKLSNGITSFAPNGKIAQQYQADTKKIKSLLSKERATRMEGSFGTEKNHYTLSKVKARTEATEKLWIFFGIHTANAVRIAQRATLKSSIDGQNKTQAA